MRNIIHGIAKLTLWMLRGIAALSCVVIAIGFLVAANHNPWLIVYTVVFVVLGLWIAGMGTGSRFARLQTPDEIAKEELEIRNGPFFGMRNRLMGFIALTLGCTFTFFIVLESEWSKNYQALLGGILFIGMGAWYLLKGRKAEGDAYYRAVAERSKSASPAEHER